MSVLHKVSGCANQARNCDVVFIHGLGGDAFITWNHGKDESTSWPRWVGNEFQDVGVWSLSYASSPSHWMRIPQFIRKLPGFGWLLRSDNSGYSMALPRRAAQVLDIMVQNGFGSRPIVFVCHSLGGLVVKQVLRKAAEAGEIGALSVYNQTRAVLFLATPHAGATLASLAYKFRKVFRVSISIEDLRAHDAHLEDLFNWYRNHAVSNIRTRTYYENQTLHGFCIVNSTSSHPGIGDDPIALDENHISIAKPRSPQSQVYRALCDLIRGCAPGRPKSSSQVTAASENVEAVSASGSSFQQQIVIPPISPEIKGATVTNIFQITQMASNRHPDTDVLNNQLSQKDEQIYQKDLQIASLHKMIESSLLKPNPTSIDPDGIDRVYEDKATEWVRSMEDSLDIDFPQAYKKASELETWTESNRAKLSKDSLAKLYHVLVRVELIKISREAPGADSAKAEIFLRKASNEIQ